MPELVLRKNAPEKASIAYSNKYLEVDLPYEYPSIGAWDPTDIEVQTAKRSDDDILYSVTSAVNSVTVAAGSVAKSTVGSVEALGLVAGVATKSAMVASSAVAVSLAATASLVSHKLTGAWIGKDNPFTQAALLNDEENEIHELIFRIRRSPVIPYRESLANRLLVLYNDAKEEDSDSPGIALGSIRYFYNFLQFHTNLKCPIVSLTPDNNIYASWKEGQNRVFSVHFLPSGDVRFVIFKPNNRHPERQIRISGTATTDTLMEMVTPNGLWDWITE